MHLGLISNNMGLHLLLASCLVIHEVRWGGKLLPNSPAALSACYITVVFVGGKVHTRPLLYTICIHKSQNIVCVCVRLATAVMFWWRAIGNLQHFIGRKDSADSNEFHIRVFYFSNFLFTLTTHDRVKTNRLCYWVRQYLANVSGEGNNPLKFVSNTNFVLVFCCFIHFPVWIYYMIYCSAEK